METLTELFHALDGQLTSEVKAEVAALDEKSLGDMHFGLNGLIRSLAFYKNESHAGEEYFSRLGMPDEASAALGELYWRHLNSLPMTEADVLSALDQHWYWDPEEIKAVAKELKESYDVYRNA
jgi:hypothetical protein